MFFTTLFSYLRHTNTRVLLLWNHNKYFRNKHFSFYFEITSQRYFRYIIALYVLLSSRLLISFLFHKIRPVDKFLRIIFYVGTYGNYLPGRSLKDVYMWGNRSHLGNHLIQEFSFSSCAYFFHALT